MFTEILRNIGNVGVWVTVGSLVLLRLPTSSGGVRICGVPLKGVIGLIEGLYRDIYA